MAVAHWIEQTTGWSIKRYVKTDRRYRTFSIAAGEHTIAAIDPVLEDLVQALDVIKDRSGLSGQLSSYPGVVPDAEPDRSAIAIDGVDRD